MSKKTLTQWFPADVKPVNVGVYEVYPSKIVRTHQRSFAYWNGEAFSRREVAVNGDIEFAIMSADMDRSSYWFPHEGVITWRGLAVKP